MGYAQTTIIAYGIKIDEETAQQIYENEFNEDGEFEDVSLYQNIHYRKAYGGSNQQNEPATPYSQHDDGSGSTVFYPEMWSNGTDSRIESLRFNEGNQHYLGIYIASRGYGYSDDINFFKKAPQEAIQSFETGIRPLMEKYGIKGRPGIRIITQVW
jgi:hypothetical protein